MSVVEIKKTIHDKIEKISSEGDLHAVLDILNKLEEKSLSTDNVDTIFVKAREKYNNVLKKLAE
jgi:predicted DNA-binding protein (UPF0278 family)